jgi:hypothetical protein
VHSVSIDLGLGIVKIYSKETGIAEYLFFARVRPLFNVDVSSLFTVLYGACCRGIKLETALYDIKFIIDRKITTDRDHWRTIAPFWYYVVARILQAQSGL